MCHDCSKSLSDSFCGDDDRALDLVLNHVPESLASLTDVIIADHRLLDFSELQIVRDPYRSWTIAFMTSSSQ
jgi:hypothetical protein